MSTKRVTLSKLEPGDDFTVTGKVISQQDGMTFVRMGGRRWYVPGGIWVQHEPKPDPAEEPKPTMRGWGV